MTTDAVRQMLGRVLELQSSYDQSNTPEMAERGQLIRRDIPSALSHLTGSLAKAADLGESDLLIEGRDHTGRKSHVPWVRVASKQYSPRATEGWYVVFLFRRDGEGVYLALECGATQFSGGSYVTRSPAYLSSRIQWARDRLQSLIETQPRLELNIDLASSTDLALSYERSTVFAYFYPKIALPSGEQVATDLLTLMSPLGRLYRAENLGVVAGSVNPEIRDALAQIERIAKPNGRRGQGFGLSAAERKAVESRAMILAQSHFETLDYKVEDRCKTESFDLLATKGDETLKVEVKGTTGNLGSVLLTVNEVELHKAHHPANALVVVHGISLVKGEKPIATGGELHVAMPWQIDEKRLRPISFSYAVLPESDD